MQKKKTKAAKRPRPRTQAQIDSECRREERSVNTLVRHTEQSAAALVKLRKRFDMSDPEIMRTALIEMATKRGRNI